MGKNEEMRTRARERQQRGAMEKEIDEIFGGESKEKAPEIFGTETLSLNGPQRD